jgi:chitinase
MYFTFNGNQWVSFDNDVTFKQKADWANSVGLGGAMIWASDLGSYHTRAS